MRTTKDLGSSGTVAHQGVGSQCPTLVAEPTEILRDADAREPLPCLLFDFGKACGNLIVEDTPSDREAALMMIFGEKGDELPPSDRIIVSRVQRTRAELEALQEWEP